LNLQVKLKFHRITAEDIFLFHQKKDFKTDALKKSTVAYKTLLSQFSLKKKIMFLASVLLLIDAKIPKKFKF